MYTFHVPVADDGEAMAKSIERAIQWEKDHADLVKSNRIFWEFHILLNEQGLTA